MSRAAGPRRTLLFLPALAERFIAGAHGKGTGTVMLDLEDSIPFEQKQAAREALPGAVASLQRRGLEVWVRLNNRPEHLGRDVDACVLDGVAGLMLPKAESPGDLTALDHAISAAESRVGLTQGTVAVSAQIETPLGVLSAQAISGGPRLAALAWGGEDYAASLGVEAGPAALRGPAAHVALAARAAGLEAWGPAWAIPEHRRMAVFERAVRVSHSLGMTGTLCVHPAQVGVAEAVYRPSDAEVAWAREVAAAYEQAVGKGLGSISVQGRMVDAPVHARARVILASVGAQS